MPIYEYVCDHCGEVTEALQRMSDPPLTECPSGDGGGLTKIFSAHNVGSSSVKFSGGGCATPAACGPEKAAACGMGGGCGSGWN